MYQYLATCPKGLGSLLAPEVTALGAQSVRETVAGVQFSGSLAVAYRVCLHSRLANRLLLMLREFAAETGDDLYTGMLSFPWHEHIDSHSTIAIDFSGRSQGIRNTQFGAQRCKDGIVDQLRRKLGSRPSVDTKHPDIRINVRLHRGKASVALDLSGQSLHRRGYRTAPGKAPLKENIAAALLMRAGWPEALEQGQPLIDPMCGSGTLLIEAAMMATRQAPGWAVPFMGLTLGVVTMKPSGRPLLPMPRRKYGPCRLGLSCVVMTAISPQSAERKRVLMGCTWQISFECVPSRSMISPDRATVPCQRVCLSAIHPGVNVSVRSRQ